MYIYVHTVLYVCLSGCMYVCSYVYTAYSSIQCICVYMAKHLAISAICYISCYMSIYIVHRSRKRERGRDTAVCCMRCSYVYSRKKNPSIQTKTLDISPTLTLLRYTIEALPLCQLCKWRLYVHFPRGAIPRWLLSKACQRQQQLDHP